MKANFTNFKYESLASSLEGHHEVCVTFKYQDKMVKRFIFIKDKPGANANYYISEAKKRIENDRDNGKLAKYAKRYGPRHISTANHANRFLLTFGIIMSAAALTFAGLFTYKYFTDPGTGGGGGGGGGETTYTVSASVANTESTIKEQWGVEPEEKTAKKGEAFSTKILLKQLVTSPTDLCFLPETATNYVTVNVAGTSAPITNFTYGEVAIDHRSATLSIPKESVTGNISISITLVPKQPVVDTAILQLNYDSDKCAVYDNQGKMVNPGRINLRPSTLSWKCEVLEGFEILDSSETYFSFSCSEGSVNPISYDPDTEELSIPIDKANTTYTLAITPQPVQTGKEITIGDIEQEHCTLYDSAGTMIKKDDKISVGKTDTSYTFSFTTEENYFLSSATIKCYKIVSWAEGLKDHKYEIECKTFFEENVNKKPGDYIDLILKCDELSQVDIIEVELKAYELATNATSVAFGAPEGFSATCMGIEFVDETTSASISPSFDNENLKYFFEFKLTPQKNADKYYIGNKQVKVTGGEFNEQHEISKMEDGSYILSLIVGSDAFPTDVRVKVAGISIPSSPYVLLSDSAQSIINFNDSNSIIYDLQTGKSMIKIPYSFIDTIPEEIAVSVVSGPEVEAIYLTDDLPENLNFYININLKEGIKENEHIVIDVLRKSANPNLKIDSISTDYISISDNVGELVTETGLTYKEGGKLQFNLVVPEESSFAFEDLDLYIVGFEYYELFYKYDDEKGFYVITVEVPEIIEYWVPHDLILHAEPNTTPTTTIDAYVQKLVGCTVKDNITGTELIGKQHNTVTLNNNNEVELYCKAESGFVFDEKESFVFEEKYKHEFLPGTDMSEGTLKITIPPEVTTFTISIMSVPQQEGILTSITSETASKCAVYYVDNDGKETLLTEKGTKIPYSQDEVVRFKVHPNSGLVTESCKAKMNTEAGRSKNTTMIIFDPNAWYFIFDASEEISSIVIDPAFTSTSKETNTTIDNSGVVSEVAFQDGSNITDESHPTSDYTIKSESGICYLLIKSKKSNISADIKTSTGDNAGYADTLNDISMYSKGEYNFSIRINIDSQYIDQGEKLVITFYIPE